MTNRGYDELVNFVKSKNWKIFGTLTFKHNLTTEQAEKALNTFWNMMDRLLYGNLSWRKNKRIKRFCVLQKGNSNYNNHIHFVAKTVKGVTVKDLIEILTYIWHEKIKASGHHNIINEIGNVEATSKYLMHEFYKLGNDTIATTSTNM